MTPDTPIHLDAEWRRLEILGAMAVAHRKGKPAAPESKTALRKAQALVDDARRNGLWSQIALQLGLESLDLDVLACVLAPEAEPQLGWLFHELQPGVGSPFPSPALIQELFVMDVQTASELRECVSSSGRLMRASLLEPGPIEQYRPLRATPFACQRVLGWHGGERHIPGTIAVPMRATWSDLILPDRCIRRLREFLLWVVQRERVVGEWGAPALGGPVALFAGPSGTGKTMAAEVIANALGWPLYRVDLGLLVSKYVGETEKNISATLDASHRAVLLFDEAESMFGRRGEIREARDRYANMEVSHLLSRIERHPGPCILTTNLRQQLDPAFARRFQVVIDFPRPDRIARAALWRKHFPPRAPVSEEVDCDALGAGCELTGGQVRNAALHAAFLAAAADTPIDLTHIASAVWTELGKDGRETLRSTLGPLAAHLRQE
jgi:hypothetical protein